MAYRLKCRKGYKKPEWNCRIESNGTQRGSYGVKRRTVGYMLTPFESVSCGAELSVSMNIMLRALREVLQSGNCAVSFSRPPAISVKKGKKPKFQTQAQVDYSCVVSELKKKFKEMKESGKKHEIGV